MTGPRRKAEKARVSLSPMNTLNKISRSALIALFQAKPMTMLDYFPVEHDGAWVLVARDSRLCAKPE